MSTSIPATQLSRDPSGWRARSEIPLSLGDDTPYVIRVETLRTSDRSLVTRVSAHRVAGRFCSHVLHQDYSEQVLCTRPSRLTEIIVRDQHDKALQMQATWYASAQSFYKAKHAAQACPSSDVSEGAMP
jgi:hypothetical protein